MTRTTNHHYCPRQKTDVDLAVDLMTGAAAALVALITGLVNLLCAASVRAAAKRQAEAADRRYWLNVTVAELERAAEQAYRASRRR